MSELSFNAVEERLKKVAFKTEQALGFYLSDEYLPQYRRPSERDVMKHPSVRKLCEAMRYSSLAGGKRIRPFLVLSFCRMFGGDEEDALPLACALEMIHTYSLIHDDLPIVDDDDLRRGRPTNHMIYGEAGALFAGDALLTHAFSVALDAPISAERRIDAVRILAECAGLHGMLGGQMTDMDAEHKTLTEDELCSLHSMKTGALIRASVRLGCLAANVWDREIIDAVDSYASDIGLAFQIVDDVLDRYGDSTVLGKSVNSDESCGKNTFMTFYSREDAMGYASRLTERAIGEISRFRNSEEAIEFARYLLVRNK